MKLTRSIRWRLQLWLAFLLATILSGFGLTAYQLHRQTRYHQIDDELSRRLDALNSDLRPGPPPEFGRGHGPFERSLDREGGPPRRRPGPESRSGPGKRDGYPESRPFNLSGRTLALFEDTGPRNFYYAIWSRGGDMVRRSTNAPENLVPPDQQSTNQTAQTRFGPLRREVAHFTKVGDCILAGCFLTEDLRAIRRFAWLLAGAGAGVLALGLGGGWLLINGATRPIEHISAAARRISEGNLSERIDVADMDSELGRLAHVLNSTFARLEAAFAQQKQFTADASHELRTPITVIVSEAQTVLAQPRPGAEYRESVKVCLEAAQQMRKITQSLLQLARYDAGQEKLGYSQFDLATQALACVDLVCPLAKQQDVQLICDWAPVMVSADPDRIGQVITNLLTNAITYNHPGGEVRIHTRAENGLATLVVADTGQGISPEDLPHIFERFYRADKARARAQGHYGLGLAICKAIVEAHGGTIRVTSQLGQGSCFTVDLPM